jgi:hypothetical protein
MKSKLPVYAWRHTILHVASLVRIKHHLTKNILLCNLHWSTTKYFLFFRIFGCFVYVPITQPQRTKMRPQRRLGIYTGFDSPSIIRYLESLTGDILKV